MENVNRFTRCFAFRIVRSRHVDRDGLQDFSVSNIRAERFRDLRGAPVVLTDYTTTFAELSTTSTEIESIGVPRSTARVTNISSLMKNATIAIALEYSTEYGLGVSLRLLLLLQL